MPTTRTEGAHSPAHTSRAVDELKSLIKGSHQELLYELQQSNKKHEEIDKKLEENNALLRKVIASLAFFAISPPSGLDAISIDE